MSATVHLVRFYNVKPNSVKFMAYEEDKELIAIARGDNSIEIWNILNSPHIQKTIVGTCGTVEGLVWFEGRLFSVGLQGSIIEYDLFTQLPKSFHPVTSGACWCVAVDKKRKQLAAGTEEGYLNIFDITEDDLLYNRLLDKQEGRIVCVAWDSKGEYLITGSVDAVRVWNVETGHAIHRMTTGRSATSKETTVWCLAVTDELTIITGDSRGKLCFWDGNTGTSIASYQSHKADIFTLSLDKKQQVVYCAGKDPLIATYEKVKMRNDDRGKWVKSIQRAIHDHEVKGLIACKDKLFSAGVDGYLALSSYPPRVLLRYPPFLQPPSVCVGGETLLLRYPQEVEIWELSSDKSSPPTKLLNWLPGGKLFVKAAAVSPDDSWLAISTLDKFRLYSMTVDENRKVKLDKVNVKYRDLLTAHCLCFSRDSKNLVIACVNGKVLSVSLSGSSQPPTSITHTYNRLKERDLHDSIHLLAVSEDATYIVAADVSRQIVIWSNGKLYCKFPTYTSAPTAMSIQKDTNYLVVVYPDHKVVEYDIEKKKFTKFSRNLDKRHPKQWLSRNFCITNVCFNPKNENIIILHDDTTVMVINKSKSLPGTEMKIPRLDTPDSNMENSESNQYYPTTKAPMYAFHVIKKYKHLVYFGSKGKNEMVAVEVSPASLKDKLPPSIKLKKFGTM